jgi:hypothetical protein
MISAAGFLRHERWGLSILIVALTLLLGIAAWLQPDPSGMGTHQQLGLPTCTSVSLLGIRCPACGMTTSWAWMIRGRVDRAMGCNIGGTILFLVAGISIPWLSWSLWQEDRRQLETWVIFAVSGVATACLVSLAFWGLAVLR